MLLIFVISIQLMRKEYNLHNDIYSEINVKKNCSLSTSYNGEMTHRKQQK